MEEGDGRDLVVDAAELHELALVVVDGGLLLHELLVDGVRVRLPHPGEAVEGEEEGLDLDRRGSVTLLGFVTLMGTGLVIWFTQDLAALDAMDFWIGSFSIFLLATIQTLIYGWVLGPRRGREELERGALLPIPRIFVFVIRYISPVYLLSVFGLWIHQKGAESLTAIQTNPSVRITLLFIISVIIFFLLLIARAVRVWHARESKSI